MPEMIDPSDELAQIALQRQQQQTPTPETLAAAQGMGAMGISPAPVPIPQPQLPPAPQPESLSKGKFFKNLLSGFLTNFSAALQKESLGYTPEEMEMQKQQIASIENLRKVQEQSATPSIAVPHPITGKPMLIAPKDISSYLRGELGFAGQVVRGAATVEAAKGRQNPITDALKAASDAFASGDMETFKNKLGLAQQLSSATKTPAQPSEIGLILRAQRGDTEAADALKTLQARRNETAKERGLGFGYGRLWQLRSVINPETQQVEYRTGFDILEAQKSGVNYIPAGPLPQSLAVGAQQLISEAGPKGTPSYNSGAIKGVRDNLDAFNNAGDKAIFARILKGAGTPRYGGEATWMGGIIDQALKGNLSSEGRKMAVNLGRLAETMGRLRSTLGAPATDSQMAVALSLLPGPSTPDSDYAGKQLDNLEQMITQAVGIPILRGVAGNKNANNKGALSEQEAIGYLQRAGGDKNKARALAKSEGRTF